jgi:hypothetical protein
MDGIIIRIYGESVVVGRMAVHCHGFCHAVGQQEKIEDVSQNITLWVSRLFRVQMFWAGEENG